MINTDLSGYAEKYFLFNSLYVLIVRNLTNNQNTSVNCLSLYLNGNAGNIKV